MSIVTRLKSLAPKTPKQWAIAAVGGTGAVLLGNYLYVTNKNDAWVMRLWHSLHHGGGPHHGHGGGGHHAHHGPKKPLPGGPHAAQPLPQAQPQLQPYLQVQPAYGAETIIEAPGYGAPMPYGPYGPYAPHYGYGGPGWHRESIAHEPFGHALPLGYVPGAHGGPGPGHPHHVGVDPGDQPTAPQPTRTVVPPPGSRGIVATTPPAPTDPPQHHHHHHQQQQLQQQMAAGVFTGVQESPCGPGLWFNAATGACVPFPTTGPVAPHTAGGYDWE